MEKLGQLLLRHKKKIVVGSAVIVAFGIGLNIYYTSSSGNDHKFIIYTENQAISTFFPQLRKEIKLLCDKFALENSKVPPVGQMIYNSVLSIYGTTLCYMIFKVQINIINQLLFVKEKDISYAKQHHFVHDVFSNWFIKDCLAKMAKLIKEVCLKEFEKSIPGLDDVEIHTTMVNIRSKFEDDFQIEMTVSGDEMNRILQDKVTENLDNFYTAYLECLEGVFGMYMQRVEDSILLENEEESIKSLQCEVDSMYSQIEVNKYISFVDKMQKLSMFCLMVYET